MKVKHPAGNNSPTGCHRVRFKVAGVGVPFLAGSYLICGLFGIPAAYPLLLVGGAPVRIGRKAIQFLMALVVTTILTTPRDWLPLEFL